MSRLVLFDGKCVLCDHTVQFLLKKDRQRILKFAPLQGQTAAAVTRRHPELNHSAQSVVFVRNFGAENEEVLQRSDALFAILRELGGFWRVLSWLRIMPRWKRDGIYNWIAKNRYQWFGKFDMCLVPEPEVKERFLP
ncbi:MAG: thiol-disulfide oxidoreductase DCC family protein [bacterium]